MRAIVMSRHGGPEVLEAAERPDPVAGPGQVLVRVAAVAVNRLDIWVREDVGHAYAARLPVVPGYDVAGEVVAVGAGVADVAVGSEVYVHYDYACGRCADCLEGDEASCARYEVMGVQRDGGYAELVVAPAAQHLRAARRRCRADSAAAAGSVYLTAYHMLFARAGLRAGETVLVTAGGSGVGGAAIALAQMAGAEVIATASTAAKRARLREGASSTSSTTPRRDGRRGARAARAAAAWTWPSTTSAGRRSPARSRRSQTAAGW